ncbi:MAG: HYR domain-containing protein, partial [Methanosarcinales archaeon]|nr:HYR domain-containing protein [Methanosarcinales archaeon]
VGGCGTATGPFANTANLTAVNPDGTIITDVSADGAVADKDGDGDPTNDSDVTMIMFDFDGSIGVAKRVSAGPILSTAGCYDVTFEIKVQNYGTTNINGVQVVEDFAAVFGAGDVWNIVSVESEEFDVNGAFDGTTDTNLLLGNDVLTSTAGGNEGAIYVTVNVCPDGNTAQYSNSVTATGTSPDGMALTDESQMGSTPDPDGDGDPTNNNDVTTFQLNCEIPQFTNCPRPNIVVDAPEGWCSSFVNFSPPIATSQCGLDTIMQTDNTGLSSGDLFPVGRTRLVFTAVDMFGNLDSCELIVIVNDFHTPPTIACSEDVEVESDPLMCGAIVENIEPTAVSDNCPNNIAVTYTLTDEAGGIIACGIEDASGLKFPAGVTTVTYMVQDQPLLLITEVNNDEVNNGLEITNIGAANYNISGMIIGREGAMDATFIVPEITILAPGDTYTQLFDAVALGTPVGYYISYEDNQIDGVSLYSYTATEFVWTGDLNGDNVHRPYACDSDHSQDWKVINNCLGSSFGVLNDEVDIYTANGDTTALQSTNPSKATCSFTVTISDTEAPYCAAFDTTAYMSIDLPQAITSAACAHSVITVNGFFQVGDVDILNLQATYADMMGLTATLTSPSGTSITLFSGMCAGTADMDINLDSQSPTSLATIACGPMGQGGIYQPLEDMSAFFGEPANGDWILDIYSGTGDIGTMDNWELRLGELVPYTQVDTLMENDLGICGAEFIWAHPVFADNCGDGSITVSYSFTNGLATATPVEGGSIETKIFNVGTTTVEYVLTDGAGNVSSCSFDVTVIDTEAPVIAAGNAGGQGVCYDRTIQLGAGACEVNVDFPTLAELLALGDLVVDDNCGVDSISYAPSADMAFEIGETEVTFIIMDAAGNADTCMFTVTVLEHDTDSNGLTCAGEIQLSLGPDCTATVTADMCLQGNGYACYDNYCVTLEDENGNYIGSSEDGTNILDLSHVGTAVKATICIDCEVGSNCCWTTINVEEKLTPEVECPADTTVSCNQGTDPIFTGEPILLTCEQDVTMTYYDEFVDGGACGTPRAQITRIWTITDESANQVQCTQVITIEPFGLDNVEFPVDMDLTNYLNCEDVANNPDLLHPDTTGYPMINGE